MNPNVDIKQLEECYFNYSVRLGASDACYACQGLRSMAECLHDAATAVGQAFRDIDLSYEGVVLGTYSVPTMEHDPLLLADVLKARLMSLRGHTTGAH